MTTNGNNNSGDLMDSKNFTIGILSTTAVILLVGLLLLNGDTAPAWGSGMTTDAGDYVLSVGQYASPDEELVYIIDTPGERLIAYRFDGGRQRIEIVQGIDLSELRQSSNQPPRPRAPGSRGRRRP